MANLRRAMKVKAGDGLLRLEGARSRAPAQSSDLDFFERFEKEHICWDPKDGELCLHRAKPEETLVEARSDSDVQIDRQMWV